MPVPSTIADLSQTAASNSPLGTDTVGPSLDDYLRAGFAFTRQVFDGSAFLLGSVAGADTITATCPVPFTAYVSGQAFRFVAAGGNTTNAPTLNVNSLGAKSLTKFGAVPLSQGDIPAGAIVTAIYDGTQFQVLSVISSVAHGQCRLSVGSATTLTLSRYNGSSLIINGLPQNVPSAGVTYTISGLAASTLYYVYAYMNAGAMTLEISTTGHATGTNGVEIKSGDATRTLVGVVATNGSTQFVDSSTAGRLCLSWFNRQEKPIQSAVTTNSTTSATPVSLIGAIPFLTWGDAAVKINASGYMSNAVAPGFVRANLYIGAGQVGADSVVNSAINGANGVLTNVYQASLAEGQYAFDLRGLSGNAANCSFNFSIGGTVMG